VKSTTLRGLGPRWERQDAGDLGGDGGRIDIMRLC